MAVGRFRSHKVTTSARFLFSVSNETSCVQYLDGRQVSTSAPRAVGCSCHKVNWQICAPPRSMTAWPSSPVAAAGPVQGSLALPGPPSPWPCRPRVPPIAAPPSTAPCHTLAAIPRRRAASAGAAAASVAHPRHIDAQWRRRTARTVGPQPGRLGPKAAATPPARASPPEPLNTPEPGARSSSSTSSASATGAGDATDAASASRPQRPLCRRPATHVDELGAALSWRAHMEERISQLGDSLEQQDGGPDMAGLMRELDWVLDDVIEAVRLTPDGPWEETSWRLLQPRVRAAERGRQDPGRRWQLRLREPVARLYEWWTRRLQDREPFQYLISSAHWHTYVLSVGPGVLVPRPETEIFPELVRTAITERPYLAAAPWADLGTGSGAIAISAADELRRRNPLAEVWAVDLSPTAVAYARFNADLCLEPERDAPSTAGTVSDGACAASSSAGSTSSTSNSTSTIRHPVRAVQGSWFEPLRHLRGRLGGVLSNPPYIPRGQMAGLQAEVGRHEPWGALDGGEGPGLESLRVLCSEAAAMLAPGGMIALETAGGDQADQVAELLRAAQAPDHGAANAPAEAAHGSAAFEEVQVLPDCYGVRRFVRAYRRGAHSGGGSGTRGR